MKDDLMAKKKTDNLETEQAEQAEQAQETEQAEQAEQAQETEQAEQAEQAHTPNLNDEGHDLNRNEPAITGSESLPENGPLDVTKLPQPSDYRSKPE